mgnify:CR=1 FL=1
MFCSSYLLPPALRWILSWGRSWISRRCWARNIPRRFFQDSGVNVFRVLVCSVSHIFSHFVYRRELFRDSKPSENLMVNLCMINGAIMFVGLFGTANYFGRLANYFTIAQVVALPWILGKLSPHDRRVLTALMVICYTGYSLYGNLVTNL